MKVLVFVVNPFEQGKFPSSWHFFKSWGPIKLNLRLSPARVLTCIFEQGTCTFTFLYPASVSMGVNKTIRQPDIMHVITSSWPATLHSRGEVAAILRTSCFMLQNMQQLCLATNVTKLVFYSIYVVGDLWLVIMQDSSISGLTPSHLLVRLLKA